jgi:hypothetical protein
LGDLEGFFGIFTSGLEIIPAPQRTPRGHSEAIAPVNATRDLTHSAHT